MWVTINWGFKGGNNLTETDDKIAIAIKKSQPDWPKWIGLILTILSLTVAAVVWASSEHSDIRAWTADQDYVTKQELQKSFEKQYVPKEDFSRLDQSLCDQKEDIKEIKDKVDKIFEIIHTRNNR